MTSTTRAQIIKRRTYNRPKKDGTYESWNETVDRVIQHQKWLWERAKNKPLDTTELFELEQLKFIILNHYCCVAGRTLWLGGTDISKKHEATQFNCSCKFVRTIADVVDNFKLLLLGCGIAFKSCPGSLFGFSQKIEKINIIPSTKDKDEKGDKQNYEKLINKNHWYLQIGDSSDAWAKSVGKILKMKYRVKEITLDFSQIRGSGSILSNYGWISSGYPPLEKSLKGIIKVLNNKINKMLDEIDILDIMNWCGSCLSSRRSAEICVMDAENPQAERFAKIKKNHWIDNQQRSQSNNTLIFNSKPTKEKLQEVFKWMEEGGGSEPGFANAQAWKRDAEWWGSGNACFEISLPSEAGFCNLVEINLLKCNELSDEKFKQFVYFISRANYRQTCVDLRDGFLQSVWHENNDFLRLCGVGLTGIIQWKHYNKPEKFRELKGWVIDACDSMADELNFNRAYLKTTCKPSGTLSKILAEYETGEICEGIHKPLGRYIFNNVRFSRNDPLVEQLKKCNYYIFNDPYNQESVLIRLPVKYDNIDFDIVTTSDGVSKEVNNEKAITQLNRYKMIMENYIQHNCSITVSYSLEEVPDIINWFLDNWDIYKGVSFIYRNDPSKTAEDLGYPYLPQEVVTKEKYDSYISSLLPFELDKKEKDELYTLDIQSCKSGTCPIR